jgi:hypothetical protein
MLIKFLELRIECLSLPRKRSLHLLGHGAKEEPRMRRVPCPEVVCNIVLGRQGKGRDIKHIPLGDVTWVHRRGRRGRSIVDRRCRRQRCHRGTGGSGTGRCWNFIIIGEHL